MKSTSFKLALLTGVLAGFAYASPARAQTPNVQYVMILLDQTGSMATVADTNSGLTFWDNAVSAAQAWVNADSNTSPLPRRAYSVWTFFDNACPGCGGGTQNGAQQVWPALINNGTATSSTDCGPSSNSQFEPATGFCVFAGSDPIFPYGALSTRLGDAGDATQTTSIRTVFRAITGVGNTPLADSLCQTLEKLQLATPGNSRILTLETDAGENDSINPCASAVSTTNLDPNATSFNFAALDWGLSVDTTNPSWEAKVMRRAVRINGTGTAPSANPASNLAAENAAINIGPIMSGENLPSGSTGYGLRIDAHFRICHPSDPPPCPTTTAFAPVMRGINVGALGVASQTPMEPKGTLRAPAIAPVKITPAMTAPFTVTTTTAAPKTAALATAAATPAPGVPLIDSNELLFFQALGHVNSKSTFHALVADSAVVFGTTHKLAGDVDDSGCVDGADYSIVKQKDVWFQRAVQPLQIAIRADLNRDGWVNKADAKIVIANWGHGCRNPVGPPPKL
jgi:hypothetical protein